MNKTMSIFWNFQNTLTYLKDYEIKDWNYYDNIEHITNNASESFNNYLNNSLPKKPHFYKFLLTLQKVESLSYDNYKRRKSGVWEQKPKKLRTDEIDALIKYYKNMEILLKKEKEDKNDFIELWLKCLSDLNIKIIN